jgi:hypothetical protein
MARLTPYQPGRRTYSPLPGHLRAQWEGIAPSTSHQLQYRPCSVALKSGAVVPCAYVMEAQAYIDVWGVWPEDDSGKQHIRVDDVASLSESPLRLPVALANQLYGAGESGMGYSAFTLVFRDGAQINVVSGGALDFVPVPDDRTAAEIIRVIPHSGRDQAPLSSPKYHWCLFGSGEPRVGSLRFV